MGPAGLEPAKAYASGFTARPLCRSGHDPQLRTEPTMGFEPMTDRLQGGCSAGLSYVGSRPDRTSALPAVCRVRIARGILLFSRLTVNR